MTRQSPNPTTARRAQDRGCVFGMRSAASDGGTMRSVLNTWSDRIRAALERVPRSRLFARYLISYLLILAVGIGVSLLAFLFSIRVIETEIARAHYNSLAQLKNIVDAKIMELEQIYIQIGFDERTLLYLGSPESDDPTLLLNTAKVIENLRLFKLSHPLIEEIYLHSFRKNQVLTDAGKYECGFFVKSVFAHAESVYRSWTPPDRFGLSAFPPSEPAREPPLSDGERNNKKLVYIRPFPVEKKTELTGVFVTVLDEEVLVSLMDELRWIDESVFFVADRHDNVLLENGVAQIEPIPRFEAIRTGADPYSIGDRMITAAASDRFDWKYVSVIPRRVFFQRAANLRNVLLLCIVSLSGIGILFAYLLARRQYSPMDELIGYIQGQVKDLERRDQDEYRFIQSLLNTTLRERKEYLEGRKRQTRRLRNQFLLRILKGEVNASTAEEMKSVYSIDLDDSSDYCVVLQVFAGEAMPFRPGKDQEEGMEEEHGSTALLLIHTMDGVLSPRFVPQYVDVEDSVIFVVPLPHGSAAEDLNDAVRRAVSISLEDLKIPVYTAVSVAHRGYAGLASAYREADETMELLLLTKKENLLFSHRRQAWRPRGARYDFRARLEQLSQTITAKDFPKARAILDSVFVEFLEEGSEPPALIHYRMHEVIHMFVNAVEDLMIYYNAYDYDYGRLAIALPQCRSIEELKRAMATATAEVQAYVEGASGATEDLQGRIMRHINTHFGDVNLNVSTLAHAFEVPVSHVSRLIKRVTGVGALEYLQLLRIERAKRLLKESDCSIREILGQIGFGSEVSFIRVFKRMEGVTPGVYRRKERG